MKNFLILTCTIFVNFLFAQQEIELKNPSFEGFSRPGNLPEGWVNCGTSDESPPDTQPGNFRVYLLPNDGKSYLGLVARQNNTAERFGQKLSTPLVAGQCYQFSIYLARSNNYWSPTRLSLDEINYYRPLKLRISGGYNNCSTNGLLTESVLVENTLWSQYDFVFQPKANWSFITFQAVHEDNEAYNGNILIDNASSIQKIDCNSVENFLMEQEQKFKQRILEDSIKRAGFAKVKSVIEQNWISVKYDKKTKSLSGSAETSLKKIFKIAKENKIQNVIIGIPQYERFFKKKVAAIESFLTHQKLPIGFVRVIPRKIDNPAYLWFMENEFFCIQIK